MEQRTVKQIRELVTEPSHRTYISGRNSLRPGEFVLLGTSARGTTILITVQSNATDIDLAYRNWIEFGIVSNLKVYKVGEAMKIGFTGTRRGMTVRQREVVKKLLLQFEHDELHHGCCEGADRECHALDDGKVATVGHPSTHPGQEAWAMRHCIVVHPPVPPLERNDHIVAACDLIIAAPAETTEVLRSGTWATIRRARAAGKPLHIVFPNGSIHWDSGS